MPLKRSLNFVLQSMDPFKTAGGDDDEKEEKPAQSTGGPNPNNTGNPETAGNVAQPSVTGKRGPGHPTEEGAHQQAATVAPEGTEEAAYQASGNADKERQIDERGSNVNGA